MDLRVPDRSWPRPPQAEGEGARLRDFFRRAPGWGRAERPADPFVLDLEPIEGGLPLPRPPAQSGAAGGGTLPHRGRLIDIQI